MNKSKRVKVDFIIQDLYIYISLHESEDQKIIGIRRYELLCFNTELIMRNIKSCLLSRYCGDYKKKIGRSKSYR